MSDQNLLIGMGAGQCGFDALRELLSRQPQSVVTIEDPPLLPWECSDPSRRVSERIQRIRKSNVGTRLICDIAAFYLPYATSILEDHSSVKVLCLRAPKDWIVQGFQSQLDNSSRIPINHWSKELATGWHYDPVWSRAFPKYEIQSRSEAIERYVQDYYEWSNKLSSVYPDRFKLVDIDQLCDESIVTRILDYAGIPSPLQNLWICPPERLAPSVSTSGPRFTDPMDPRRCVVLVPFGMFIHQECEAALKELERRGYEVRRVGGYAAIDQGRNQMATDALRDGFEETFWIDSDIGFHPDDVDNIRRHNLPIVCGIYPQKGKRALACHVAPGMPSITFGKEGNLVEILYAGAGFLNIRREAYDKVQNHLKLNVCNERFGSPMIPYFHPMVREIEEAHWYLAEDYAFCERARECGLKTFADTSVRLWHIGNYRYGWEDAGMDRPRFSNFSMNFKDMKAPRTEGSQNNATNISNLSSRYEWPEHMPSACAIPDRIWISSSVRRALSDSIHVDDQCIVELGCWFGRASRYLSELASKATVICLDQWIGYEFANLESEEIDRDQFEDFISECWDLKGRIVPMRKEYLAGLREIADSGIQPNTIFFNAICDTPGLFESIVSCLDLFPRATLLGHCYDRKPLADGLDQLREKRRFRLDTLSTAWRIGPRNS